MATNKAMYIHDRCGSRSTKEGLPTFPEFIRCEAGQCRGYMKRMSTWTEDSNGEVIHG